MNTSLNAKGSNAKINASSKTSDEEELGYLQQLLSQCSDAELDYLMNQQMSKTN